MPGDSPLHGTRDVYEEAVAVAYALRLGEVELFRKIGTTRLDVNHLCILRRTGNMLNALPVSQQASAKAAMQNISMAAI